METGHNWWAWNDWHAWLGSAEGHALADHSAHWLFGYWYRRLSITMCHLHSDVRLSNTKTQLCFRSGQQQLTNLVYREPNYLYLHRHLPHCFFLFLNSQIRLQCHFNRFINMFCCVCLLKKDSSYLWGRLNRGCCRVRQSVRSVSHSSFSLACGSPSRQRLQHESLCQLPFPVESIASSE